MYREEISKAAQIILKVSKEAISNNLRDDIIATMEEAKTRELPAEVLVDSLHALSDKADDALDYIEEQTRFLDWGDISLSEWMINVGKKIAPRTSEDT